MTWARVGTSSENTTNYYLVRSLVDFLPLFEVSRRIDQSYPAQIQNKQAMRLGESASPSCTSLSLVLLQCYQRLLNSARPVHSSELSRAVVELEGMGGVHDQRRESRDLPPLALLRWGWGKTDSLSIDVP